MNFSGFWKTMKFYDFWKSALWVQKIGKIGPEGARRRPKEHKRTTKFATGVPGSGFWAGGGDLGGASLVPVWFQFLFQT